MRPGAKPKTKTKTMKLPIKSIVLTALLILPVGLALTSCGGADNRQDNRAGRQYDRQDNRGDRQDNRGDRQDDRQDNRDDRQDDRRN